VGHDKNAEAAKEAQRLGAVDDIKYNLPASIRDAQIVILALPFASIRETLEIIAPDLQEGALVMDTAPAKATVAAWAKELLPPERFYVGLTPAINPQYLEESESGVRAARADLFHKGLIVVNTPMGTPEASFNVAMEVVSLVGAMPLLMDTAEADGTFATVHLLPQLIASALLDATVDKPGWQEARKLAGRPFASVTAGSGLHDDAASLSESVLQNRENIVRLLNTYITSLIQLRDDISDQDRDALTERLEHAVSGHERWLNERFAGEWLPREGQQVKVPSFGDRMNQSLFGSLFSERKPRK
jgi:prephenate dehydrogenase